MLLLFFNRKIKFDAHEGRAGGTVVERITRPPDLISLHSTWTYVTIKVNRDSFICHLVKIEVRWVFNHT